MPSNKDSAIDSKLFQKKKYIFTLLSHSTKQWLQDRRISYSKPTELFSLGQSFGTKQTRQPHISFIIIPADFNSSQIKRLNASTFQCS